MVLNDSPTAEKVAKGIVKQLLKGDIADPISEPSDLEAVEGWITKHGESLTAEEIKAVVEDTRSLREKGARFTP
jgi:hypothetical protein